MDLVSEYIEDKEDLLYFVIRKMVSRLETFIISFTY